MLNNEESASLQVEFDLWRYCLQCYACCIGDDVTTVCRGCDEGRSISCTRRGPCYGVN